MGLHNRATELRDESREEAMCSSRRSRFALFEALGTRGQWERGGNLFLRGEKVAVMFLVLSGRVRLERTLRQGSPLTLAVFRSGDLVAEASLYAERYHCDAIAESRCRVLRVPRDRLLDRLRNDPTAADDLLRLLSTRLRRARALLEVRSIRRADDRVLAFLELLDLNGERWGSERPVRDVAAEIGVAPETLYRSLARLERNGAIRRVGRGVERAL